MSKTTFNQSEAALIVGVTRDTIRAHMKKGRLSSILDVNGNKKLERSELLRVYGNDLDFSVIEKANHGSNIMSGSKDDSGARISQLEQQLDLEKDERSRERIQYEKEIERLANALEKSQEGHNKATLLLEHHSKQGGGWEQAFNALKNETANAQQRTVLEMQQLKEQMRKRESQLKNALETERNKSLWQKLWK